MVISGQALPRSSIHRPTFTVSQERLAFIQELDSSVTFMSGTLIDERAKLRKDMMNGAVVEPGPIRAWIVMRFRKKRGRKNEAVVTYGTLHIK